MLAIIVHLGANFTDEPVISRAATVDFRILHAMFIWTSLGSLSDFIECHEFRLLDCRDFLDESE